MTRPPWRSGFRTALTAMLGLSTSLWAMHAGAATELDPVLVTARPDVGSAAHSDRLDVEDLATLPALAIDDVLRQVPAFGLLRRSSGLVANPTTQGVTLRALAPSGASRSLVLLDDIPLNDPFGGWVQWQRVPMLTLHSAEIARGGLSSAWGSAALAGTVRLQTQPDQPLQTRVEAGRFDTYSLHGHGATDVGSSRAWLGGALRRSSGYPVLRADQRGRIDTPAFAEMEQVQLGVQTETDTLRWRAEGGMFAEDRGNGTQQTDNRTDIFWLSSRLEQQTATGRWRWVLYAQDQEFAARFSAQDAQRENETPALDQYAVPSVAQGSSLEWQGQETWAQWSAGLDLRRVDGETRERFFFSEGSFQRERQAGAEQWFGGAWLQRDWDLEALALSAALRVDQWQVRDARRREFNRADGSILLEQSPADRKGLEWSPRLDARWPLRAGWQGRLAAYRAFRVPTINELVRPFRVRNDITAANPDLVPETLTGVDLGLDGRLGPARVQLTAFWSRLDDAVANLTLGEGPGMLPPCGFVPAGGSCRQRQNLEQIRALGLELSAEGDFSSAWSWSTALLRNRQTVHAGPESLRGRRVALAPGLRASAQLRYRGPLLVDLGVRHDGRHYEDDLNTRPLPSCTTWNLGLGRTLGRASTLRLLVENIGDQVCIVGESGEGLQSTGAPRVWSLQWTWRYANL